ncbi:hypothetical protein GQ85_11035 [Rhodococcus rhodochrous]|nr:hypothetical protein GQ85_11035 [Rhodococcus rhodochrous]
MLVFATADDYAAYPDAATAPANLGMMLREASLMVREVCRSDLFDTDPTTGMPTDTALVEALRDATCAQAEVWAATAADPVKGPGGQDPRLTVSAIDGASVSFDTYLTMDARARALVQLAPSAVRHLRNAGLASAGVVS